MSGADAVKPGERRFESPLNLFCVLALEAGAGCAEATDDPDAARRWREAAQKLRGGICRRFWNAEKGEVEVSLDAKVQPAEFVQALALLADAVPEDARPNVIRKLMTRSEWTEITLSQTLYKYEALIAAGGEAARTAVRMMDEEWSRMLKAGATSFWEMREGWSAFDDAGSLCHGWSAVPVYIYGRYPEFRYGVDAVGRH